VVQHIETVRSDLIENFGMFVMKGNDEGGDASEIKMGGPFDRYEVNVLVTLDGAEQAPIIEELHPALGNLIGRIEYVPLHGALLTNFRLVKAGAIHRANGGYLLLDARSVLMEPFSWAAVKRTLRRGEIAIEDIGRFLGLTSTVSLEPDPIPLNLKVILFGDRLLYFLLAALDPELQEHFKVLADFENDLARTPENEADFARLLAALAQREGLNALDREGVALMLEHTARSAEHSGKLSLAIEQVREILVEADFCARAAKRSAISREDVDGALKARIRRAARLRDRAQEAILEKVALIDTSGTHIGQINGLSVTELGGFSFGRPTRITCQVRPGAGKVIDIEREVELGGPLHSKGVLILSGFLAGRYALDTPMSLSASLVFEQSHGGVEGDSASSAELYALLSAIAEVPLRQDLAATGSVNQHGQLQAIGRVNEKIEGFFDTCERRGLTGTQGVLIPQSNVQHLMLRKDVRDACAAGRFAVYPVATLDEGIALLTGLSAGMRGTDGAFPLNSVNRRVEDRLRSFCQHSTEFYRSEQQLWSSGQLAMRKGPHSFRRIVLGLQPGAHERTMQLAVELADLLHLDLLGLLLEDTSLRDLANIPFSREFRLLDGGWHAIDLDRVAHDFELAARIIKRKFTEAAKGLPTGSQFEIARKSLTETFASVSRTDDIIMIVEPQNPAERATQQFSWLLEAALRSAAAVMLVPPRVARTKGPIVAIGQSADDPGIHTAAAIALATKEELVILEADGGDDNEPLLRELTADHSLSVQHIRIDSMGLTDPAVCAQIFRRVQERLIVIARGTFENDFVSTIAATRRVPVLIVEPLESPSKEST
jgi:predicted ATP-dependent protease